MIKKTVSYVDYNGNERKEDFYFNLTEAEVTEMELSTKGGLASTLEKIVSEKDQGKIVEIFKDLVLRSYGEKSPDGKLFVKTKEVRENFSFTEAYSKIFMELATNSEAAAAFINGVLPQVK